MNQLETKRKKPPKSTLTVNATKRIAKECNLSVRDVELAALMRGVTPTRYSKHIQLIGENGEIKLLESKVGIVGVKEEGTVAIELLSRLGVGELVILDEGVLTEDTLGCQILSTEANIKREKSEEIRLRVADINTSVRVTIYKDKKLSEDDLMERIMNLSVLLCSTNNPKERELIAKLAKRTGIPLIHGACSGFCGEVSTIFQEDLGLEVVYKTRARLLSLEKKELKQGMFPSTPLLVGAWQVNEAVKIILKQEPVLRNKLFFFNLATGKCEIVELKG